MGCCLVLFVLASDPFPHPASGRTARTGVPKDGCNSHDRSPLILTEDSMRALVVVLLLVVSVAAQDKPKPKPDTDKQAADKVVAAFTAKDEKTLASLAAKDKPDPWLVADELCFRGEHDAAEAFAKAAPRKDTERLPAYVLSRRGKLPNAEAREALATANKALRAGDPKAALAAIEAVDANATDVVSVRLLYERGVALRSLHRLAIARRHISRRPPPPSGSGG